MGIDHSITIVKDNEQNCELFKSEGLVEGAITPFAWGGSDQ